MIHKGVIPSLDGLRAVSIAIVFFGHAGLGAFIPATFGVTVFFFLSGFLITSLMLKERVETGRLAFRAFYLRRLLRLSPPLLVVLIGTYALVAFGIIPGQIDPATIAAQLLYYFNYWSVYGTDLGPRGLDVLWSLAVEEHFYLVYPLLLTGVLIKSPRHAIGVLVGVIVLSLLWRIGRFTLGGAELEALYRSTDTRLDAMAFGCLLAFLQYHDLSHRLLPKAERAMLLTIGGCLLALGATVVIRDELFRAAIRYTVQGAALLPIFAYAVTRPEHWLFRPLNWAWVKTLGVYSYTIYLVHLTAYTAVEPLIPAYGQLPVTLLAGALSVGTAALIYQVVEQPVARVRKQLHAKPPTL